MAKTSGYTWNRGNRTWTKNAAQPVFVQPSKRLAGQEGMSEGFFRAGAYGRAEKDVKSLFTSVRNEADAKLIQKKYNALEQQLTRVDSDLLDKVAMLAARNENLSRRAATMVQALVDEEKKRRK